MLARVQGQVAGSLLNAVPSTLSFHIDFLLLGEPENQFRVSASASHTYFNFCHHTPSGRMGQIFPLRSTRPLLRAEICPLPSRSNLGFGEVYVNSGPLQASE